MVTRYLYLGFLALLAAERAVELRLSRRHAAWAFERGGIEFGRGHFRFMKALHGSFFLACGTEVFLLDRPFTWWLAAPMLALALAAQALRYWAIFTLGPYWNVRVIVIPNASPVTSGPYRFLRHPNYLAVVLEGFAVPLLHSAWLTAAGFSLLDGFLLRTRIRCEEEALAAHCSYPDRLGGLPRLIPGPRVWWRASG